MARSSLLHPQIAFVREHLKQAAGGGGPETSYGLSGRLYASESGWILLSVPNALVRGCFAALDEPGAELPPSSTAGGLNAHISVIRPEELATIGGPDAITERGKSFGYSIDGFQSLDAPNWPEISKCWLLRVRSLDLQNLRKSYGLPPLPQLGGKGIPFHITVAVRRKNVLRDNAVKKAHESASHD